MRTVIVGRDFSTLPISSSNGKLRGLMVALSVSKKIFCLSSIFSCVTTMCVYFFGQPSLSGGPGSFGHLSAASGTPSLSLSGSGQPSLSSKPSLSSGSFGHLSSASARPSVSLSGSGQPSASSNLSLSSGSLGHLSVRSAMPSLSLSGSGQPSASSKPSLSSGRSGHLSTLSRMPSPSRSPTGLGAQRRARLYASRALTSAMRT